SRGRPRSVNGCATRWIRPRPGRRRRPSFSSELACAATVGPRPRPFFAGPRNAWKRPVPPPRSASFPDAGRNLLDFAGPELLNSGWFGGPKHIIRGHQVGPVSFIPACPTLIIRSAGLFCLSFRLSFQKSLKFQNCRYNGRNPAVIQEGCVPRPAGPTEEE